LVKQIKTGIPGLDELIYGGLPQGRCVLLLGGPGSGKTIFGLQFLYEGATEYNEPGVFVALCESPEEIRDNALQFGWDLRKLEKEGKLLIVDARPVSVTEAGYIVPTRELFQGEKIPFSRLVKLISDDVSKIKCQRLVLDSMNVLTLQYESDFHIRQGALGLIQALSRIGCTTLIICEKYGEKEGEEKEVLLQEYLAHGVAVLHYIRREGLMIRAFQILKMRGTKHSMQVHPLEISDKGIIIHPKERVIEA
jgi:circadian clock protein KaiC